MIRLTRRSVISALALSATITVSHAGNSGWIEPGPDIPDVTLTDQDGKEWRLSKLLGPGPVLIDFFFTGCSSICPTQTVSMEGVRQVLVNQSSNARDFPLLLSVSLDPLSDTPEAMRQYAEHLGVNVGRDARWLMLTGQFSDLTQVWQAFGQLLDTPEKHNGWVWIGQPQNRRWTRVSSNAPADSIVSLALEPKS